MRLNSLDVLQPKHRYRLNTEVDMKIKLFFINLYIKDQKDLPKCKIMPFLTKCFYFGK